MTASNESHASGTDRAYSGDYERSTFEHGVEPYKDPAVLRKMYHDDGMSQSEIGRRFDVSQQTIAYWLDKFEIETRPPMNERNRSISKSHQRKGKVMYHVPDGDGGRAAVYQHQLVALLEFDPSEVFADDTHTHHEMGSPISIDIPENLDILGDREHIRLHAGGGDCSHPELVLADVFGERINFQSQKQSKLHHWTHRLREANTTASAD